MKQTIQKEVKIPNKKASFQFNLIKKYEAGIILRGTEVKAVRMGQVSIQEAFCHFHKDELYIKNMNINEYEMGSVYNHKPKQERKLLLHKRELESLQNKIKLKGYTIIPTLVSINERGFVKVEIALAQGKKVFDKRETIKKRDNQRELDRMKKK